MPNKYIKGSENSYKQYFLDTCIIRLLPEISKGSKELYARHCLALAKDDPCEETFANLLKFREYFPEWKLTFNTTLTVLCASGLLLETEFECVLSDSTVDGKDEHIFVIQSDVFVRMFEKNEGYAKAIHNFAKSN